MSKARTSSPALAANNRCTRVSSTCATSLWAKLFCTCVRTRIWLRCAEQLHEFKSTLDERHDVADLKKSPVDYFSAGLVDDSNSFEWDITIIGPSDTLLCATACACAALSAPLAPKTVNAHFPLRDVLVTPVPAASDCEWQSLMYLIQQGLGPCTVVLAIHGCARIIQFSEARGCPTETGLRSLCLQDVPVSPVVLVCDACPLLCTP